MSNGLTLCSVSKGQWKHPDTEELVAERMIPVRFYSTKEQAIKIAEFTKSHYTQHTVMVYAISDEVLFI